MAAFLGARRTLNVAIKSVLKFNRIWRLAGPNKLQVRDLSSGQESEPKPVLTLFTKEQCSLCEDAKAVLEKYRHRYKFEEVYITDKGNEHWYDKYKYDIPVFHLNGTF